MRLRIKRADRLAIIFLLLALVLSLRGIASRDQALNERLAETLLPGLATTASQPTVPPLNWPASGALVIDHKNFLAAMELVWSGGEETCGRQIEMVGFVFSDPQLATSDFVLARNLVDGQAGETVVAGLLCRWPKRSQLQDGQWIKVQGRLDRLRYYDLKQQQSGSMPFVHVDRLQTTERPNNEPIVPSP